MRLVVALFVFSIMSFSSYAYSCNCDKAKSDHTCSAECKGGKDNKSCEGNHSCEKKNAPSEKSKK